MAKMQYFTTAILVGLALFSTLVFAQKGTGEATGVARQAVLPSLVTLSGKIQDIKTGPCEGATGRSVMGTHLIIQSEDGKTLNVHLGPATAVDHVVEQLTTGQSLTIQAFRTDPLPENAYIAKTLTLDDKVVHLRDDNLRPSWAYGPGGGQGRGPGRGRGQGQGGWGPCW